MRLFRLAICITAIVLPLAASAQVGPCGAGNTCASGQICVGPEGARLCYRTCNPAAASGASDACPTGEACARPTGIGQDVCELATPTAASSEPVGETPEEVPFVPISPQLGVPIPGGSLSVPTRESGVVRVAFLAEYINAAYRYLSTIALVIAIVMVVYGGFLYLGASAGVGEITRGKKIIIDAIMGMLLILGSYGILNIINPETTNLKVLELAFVEPEELILRTTIADTSGTDGVEASPGPSTSPRYDSCPVQLTQPAATPFRPSDPRITEFVERIRTIITGTRPERVLAVAEAATKCGLTMGACGNTAETVYRAVGISGHGRSKHAIGSTNTRFLRDLTQNCRVNNNTTECKRAARQSAAQQFRSDVDGWPNSFTDDLHAGDFINVFTVWTSDRSPNGAGQHSAIFVEWVGSNGMAKLFNGAYGTNVRYSNYCITDECGDRMYPVTNVWSPD